MPRRASGKHAKDEKKCDEGKDRARNPFLSPRGTTAVKNDADQIDRKRRNRDTRADAAIMQRLDRVPARLHGVADNDLRGEDHGHCTGDTGKKPDDGESRDGTESGHGKKQHSGGKQAAKGHQPLPPRPP
ncbi:hypothetical protein D3C72_1506930 [compost metagenome]